MSSRSSVETFHGSDDEPVHVGPDDADLGRGGRDPAHPVDLLDRPGADLLRHAGGLDLLAELVDLGLLRVVLAQLALDRLELLAEDVLPLGLVHLGLDLALDLPLELEDLDLAREERADELEPLLDVDRLEQLLALLGRHVGAVRHHVGEEAGLGDVARGDGGLGRDRGAVRDVLLDLRLHAADERLDLDALGRLVGELLDARGEVRARLAKPWTRMRVWPWTIARTVPSWSCTTWAILASVPTSYSSDGSPMSSCSAWRWVTSAIGPPASTAALSAATLFSRPTWSGTIISGKMTVSRSATSGSSRSSGVAGSGSCLVDGVDVRLAISWSPWVPAAGSAMRFGCVVSGVVGFAITWAPNRRRGRDPQSRRPPSRPFGGGRLGGLLTGSFVVEGLEDALAEALLELEQGRGPRRG